MQTRRACPALVERAPIVAWARIDPEALTMTFPSSDHLANPASYGQAGGKPRRFNAKKIDKAFQPMFGRSRDDEVSIAAFTGDLRANATIGRNQLFRLNGGPYLLCCFEKARMPALIDIVSTEQGSVGVECVSTCRFGLWPYN